MSNPNDWVGDRRTVQEYLEPMVLGTIISPSIYLPAIMELCHSMVRAPLFRRMRIVMS